LKIAKNHSFVNGKIVFVEKAGAISESIA